MRTFILILSVLFTLSALASPQKFQSLIEKAYELEHDGKKSEAIKTFSEAYAFKDKSIDKLPVLIELVRLHREDKKQGTQWLKETEKWLATRPEQKEKFSPWIETMRAHFEGTADPKSAPYALKDWATTEKVTQLMKEKKFTEAWALYQPYKLNKADLRSKIIHDLLSAVVEKNKKENFLCQENLIRHPSSQAWTIKVCRFLQDWKKNKSDPSLKKSIASQIQEEEPQSSYISLAVEEL